MGPKKGIKPLLRHGYAILRKFAGEPNVFLDLPDGLAGFIWGWTVCRWRSEFRHELRALRKGKSPNDTTSFRGYLTPRLKEEYRGIFLAIQCPYERTERAEIHVGDRLWCETLRVMGIIDDSSTDSFPRNTSNEKFTEAIRGRLADKDLEAFEYILSLEEQCLPLLPPPWMKLPEPLPKPPEAADMLGDGARSGVLEVSFMEEQFQKNHEHGQVYVLVEHDSSCGPDKRAKIGWVKRDDIDSVKRNVYGQLRSNSKFRIYRVMLGPRTDETWVLHQLNDFRINVLSPWDKKRKTENIHWVQESKEKIDRIFSASNGWLLDEQSGLPLLLPYKAARAGVNA